MRLVRQIQGGAVLKGKLHVFDVLGISLANQLKPGTVLPCVFTSSEGEEFASSGKINPERHLQKAIASATNSVVGGSLVFENWPGEKVPVGWELAVEVPE